MRIVSPYRDYYDGVMAHAMDTDLVYVRKPKAFKCGGGKGEIKTRFSPPVMIQLPFGRTSRYPGHKVFTIGFCGRIYRCVHMWACKEPWTKYDRNHQSLYRYKYNPLIPSMWSYLRRDEDPEQIRKSTPYPLDDDDNYISEFAHNAEQVIAFFTKHYFTDKRDKDQQGRYGEFCAKWREFFERNDGVEFHAPFTTHNVPNFVLHKDFVFFNDCLKKYGFARKFDPYTAYQELSMYVGGVLRGPSVEMVQIKDEDKVKAKGFNKWSFRREPGTKRGRKKRKKK